MVVRKYRSFFYSIENPSSLMKLRGYDGCINHSELGTLFAEPFNNRQGGAYSYLLAVSSSFLANLGVTHKDLISNILLFFSSTSLT